MKKITPGRIGPWICLFGLTVILLASCSNIPGSGSDAVDSVDTGAVETITISENIEATGNIEAAQEASLAWKTSGVVDEVLVLPGDRVEAGQVLASLQETSVPASILAAEVDMIAG